ncbi:MAG: DinB family protein [Bryobacteraceae bacterium]
MPPALPNHQRLHHLVHVNIGWLDQAVCLVGSLSDSVYAEPPTGFAPHKAGSHLRHILDFYDSFLAGVESGAVDYDARSRDRRTEYDRQFAIVRIREIAKRFLEIDVFSRSESLLVRMEDADVAPGLNPWMKSSVSRELQMLSSHTIHHVALIAVTLTAHGIALDPDFGMAPSTIRFRERQEAA